MQTLTGKFQYEELVPGLGLPAEELVFSLCNIDKKKYEKIKKKTYVYDIYISIILSVSKIFANDKDDMKNYIRGQLDSSKYLCIIHEELANLYICYKNSSDEDKKNRGYCTKKVNSAFRDDIYTTAYFNLDEEITFLYNSYTHCILHRITEHSILNNLEKMSM